jgi:hypothetical protein
MEGVAVGIDVAKDVHWVQAVDRRGGSVVFHRSLSVPMRTRPTSVRATRFEDEMIPTAPDERRGRCRTTTSTRGAGEGSDGSVRHNVWDVAAIECASRGRATAFHC